MGREGSFLAAFSNRSLNPLLSIPIASKSWWKYDQISLLTGATKTKKRFINNLLAIQRKSAMDRTLGFIEEMKCLLV